MVAFDDVEVGDKVLSGSDDMMGGGSDGGRGGGGDGDGDDAGLNICDTINSTTMPVF